MTGDENLFQARELVGKNNRQKVNGTGGTEPTSPSFRGHRFQLHRGGHVHRPLRHNSLVK
jgi:hypothetical protein